MKSIGDLNYIFDLQIKHRDTILNTDIYNVFIPFAAPRRSFWKSEPISHSILRWVDFGFIWPCEGHQYGMV